MKNEQNVLPGLTFEPSNNHCNQVTIPRGGPQKSEPNTNCLCFCVRVFDDVVVIVINFVVVVYLFVCLVGCLFVVCLFFVCVVFCYCVSC